MPSQCDCSNICLHSHQISHHSFHALDAPKFDLHTRLYNVLQIYTLRPGFILSGCLQFVLWLQRCGWDVKAGTGDWVLKLGNLLEARKRVQKTKMPSSRVCVYVRRGGWNQKHLQNPVHSRCQFFKNCLKLFVLVSNHARPDGLLRKTLLECTCADRARGRKRKERDTCERRD